MNRNSGAGERSLFRRELRAAREPLRLVGKAATLRNSARGDQGVVVLPGYGTNDAVTSPMRRFLQSRGHRVWGWGLGKNRGDVAGDLPAVMAQVKRRHIENDERPLSLIGWSLGGIHAREIARDRPDLIAQVITMATPIYGGPRFTVAADTYTRGELAAIDARIAKSNARRITRPITSFYSRFDGAVDWRACIDRVSPDVDNIEVESSHLGITLDPTVWMTIAALLSRDLE